MVCTWPTQLRPPASQSSWAALALSDQTAFQARLPLNIIVLLTLSPGKQARNFNDDQSRKNDASIPQQQPVQQKAMPASEPLYGHHLPPQEPQPHEAYSEAPMDARNRVAQADNAAAHHAEQNQQVQNKNSKSKRVDEANLQKLIAEENASKGKFPRYPGLERWTLMEKMGDGAFSNVYRAHDTTGEYGEVAIKVVRKYEMNSMQVSVSPWLSLLCFMPFYCPRLILSYFLSFSWLSTFLVSFLPTQGVAPI